MDNVIALDGMRGIRVQLAMKINIVIEQFLDDMSKQPALANVPVEVLVSEVMGGISLATLESENIALYLASKIERKDTP